MTRFPAYNYRKVIKKLKKLGFVFDRQAKGSHELWYNPETRRRVLIPRHHGKILKRKTLKSIIGETELTIKEFVNF